MANVLLRKDQQIRGVDAIRGGETNEHFDAQRNVAALDRVDVRAIDADPMGDAFDFEPLLLADLLEPSAERFAE
jgi:hypothetical protein